MLATSNKTLSRCCQGVLRELRYLTETENRREAKAKINALCETAYEETKVPYTDIHESFSEDFMSKYIEGGTDLNEGYGNMQTPADDNNDENCNDDLSEEAEEGRAVGDFRDHAEVVGLKNLAEFDLDRCSLQSFMCCFSRDRQCGDNNGNCRENNCVGKDPADNTNLCYMEAQFPGLDEIAGGETFHLFPGESEGE